MPFHLVCQSDSRPYFTGETSPGPGAEFALRQDQPNLIGRGPQATICIKDSRVARVQCELRWSETDQAFQIHGHAVPNPTLVNGEPVTAARGAPLIVGDQIQVGGVVLLLATT